MIRYDDCTIRSLKPTELPVLTDFLYEAIFVPEGEEPPGREIVNAPELQVYVKDFGKEKDDRCLVAETGGRVVGAVWTRIMDDYGHIDDETPSFAIALYPEYRGQGLGTVLMERMLAELSAAGYEKASLSVQKENRAARLYRRLGFQIFRETEEEYVMVKHLENGGED